MPVLEMLIVLGLVLLNGYFAMSELAVVSARPARLEALARQGRRGPRLALALAREPGRMLSTVQIGITLVGIVAGAFGAAALAEPLDDALARVCGQRAHLGWSGEHGALISLGFWAWKGCFDARICRHTNRLI